MINNKLEITKTIMRDVLFSYLICFVIIIGIKLFFGYLNGEEITEVGMLTFRSYLLGTLTTEEKVFSMLVDNIGIFAIHFTLFFSLLFYSFISSVNVSKALKVVGSLISFIVGVLLIIFVRTRFLFCIPFALTLSGIICIFDEILSCKINGKILVIFNRVFIITVSLIGIILVLLPYIYE